MSGKYRNHPPLLYSSLTEYVSDCILRVMVKTFPAQTQHVGCTAVWYRCTQIQHPNRPSARLKDQGRIKSPPRKGCQSRLWTCSAAGWLWI
jgi:hypothetical protein